MPRLTRIEAEYSDHIREAVGRFGDHEGITAGHILKWIGQFADEHLPLAGKVLQTIRYYGAANIRAMARELVYIIWQEFPGVDRSRVIFVPVGSPGSGADIIVRILRQLQEVRGTRIVTMADLERIDPGGVSGIVFIDDFSGTGDQLAEWWGIVEPIVRPKEVPILVALLVMNGRARSKIEEFAQAALCVNELDEGADVFSEHNGDFDEIEKGLLLQYCERTGCEVSLVRGYGSCGLLVGFRHGCPNNSLPILWFEHTRWRSLFMRRGI